MGIAMAGEGMAGIGRKNAKFLNRVGTKNWIIKSNKPVGEVNWHTELYIWIGGVEYGFTRYGTDVGEKEVVSLARKAFRDRRLD